MAQIVLSTSVSSLNSLWFLACNDFCIGQLRAQISDAEALVTSATENFLNRIDSLEVLEQQLLVLSNDIARKKVFVVFTWWEVIWKYISHANYVCRLR